MNRTALPSIQLRARPSGLKFRAPESARKRWSQVSMRAAAGEISILTEIGAEAYGGYSAAMMQKSLKTLGRAPVKLMINSPGGDAFEGIAIFNMLKEYPGKVTVCVYGMAASAASIIAMAGDRIEIGEASMLMIHSASGMVMGNSADMSEFAELLGKIDEQVAELYARRTGKPVKDILALMRKETWMSAKDAVEAGFADASIAEADSKKKDDKDKAYASASARSSLPALATSALLAASGTPARTSVVMSISPPGVTGSFQGNVMQTMEQTVAALREHVATLKTRQGEVHMRLKTEPTPEDRAEFDSIDAELVRKEDELRIASYDLRMSQVAQPVYVRDDSRAFHPTGTPNDSRVHAGMRVAPFLNLKVKDQDDKFPGQSFIRKVVVNALAYNEMQQGRFVSPVDIAMHRGWQHTNPTLVNVIKMAATPGFGTGTGEAGAELAQSDTRYTGDFIEFLYGLTVFDRLPLRQVPARVVIKGTDGAATGYWPGESKAIPVTTGSASSVELTPLKVAAIAVASNEILADASPSAEMWIRDLLANALAQRVDQTFLSASAASAGVSPAGILNGISAGTSAGTSADNIRTDLMTLAQNFIDARNARNLWVVTSHGLGLAIKLLKNALGQPEFDGVTMDGGTIEGFNLMFGDNVGSGDVIMLKPDEIWKIGDSGIQVSFSRDATIEQQTDPSGATDTPVGMTTTNATNMFQEDSTAIRVIRRINYQKRRTHAVAFIGDAAYGGVAS